MVLHLAPFIEAWQSCTVLVLGDVMLDCYLNGTVDRLCQEAPVPVVAVSHQQDFPGGAANVAANVSRLGARTVLLSMMGADDAGARLRSRLQDHQVLTHELILTNQRSTLTKQRVVGNSQLLVRFDQGSTYGLSEDLEQQLVQRLTEVFPSCDAVIVSDYGYGVMTPRVIQTLAALQKCYPRTVVIDSKQLVAYQAVQAAAVKPNYAETLKLLGLAAVSGDRKAQVEPHAPTLLQVTGAERVAVTLDRDGVLMVERNQPPLHFPTRPAPPHQTSGAGDTFISTLTLALAAQAPTVMATALATTATAIVVTQSGTTVCTVEDLRCAIDRADGNRQSGARDARGEVPAACVNARTGEVQD